LIFIILWRTNKGRTYHLTWRTQKKANKRSKKQKKEETKYCRWWKLNSLVHHLHLRISQPTQTPPAASTMSARSQGDKVCRLEDAQGYEFVHVQNQKKEQIRGVCGWDAALYFAACLSANPKTPCGIDDEGSLSGTQGVSPGGCTGLWVCTRVKTRKRNRGVCGCDAALCFAACLSANPKTPAASTISARSQGDKVCRLEDAQGYEFVPVWKPEIGIEECAAVMQPFASLPGYLTMGLAQLDAG